MGGPGKAHWEVTLAKELEEVWEQALQMSWEESSRHRSSKNKGHIDGGSQDHPSVGDCDM